MTSTGLNCLLISDFTLDPLVHFLQREDTTEPLLQCIVTPIDQVRQNLQNIAELYEDKKPLITIIWTQPDRQIPAFNQIFTECHIDTEKIRSEVSEFTDYLRMASAHSNIVFFPSWTLPSYYRGLGILDYKNSIGVYNTLVRMNLQLVDELHECENFYILNSQQWICSVAVAEDERMWYLGKIPFSRNLFNHAAHEIKAGIQAIYGQTKKLLVLDLDNTLWGGVLGELGIEGIRLGGLDPVGEAFVDFQKEILKLKKRGILLAIASKNEEDAVIEVFDKHPEMILKKNDFVTWRINWRDKAQNIVEIVTELNLGLQSVVFIDDNPSERARVVEALPEVYVPDWPREPIHYKRKLWQLRCFDTISLSREDTQRTVLYQNEHKRKIMLKSILSIEEWLHTLNLKLDCEELSDLTTERAVQFLNKVNQFNLITRRMGKTEFSEFSKKEKNKVWIFHASDRIGEYGMVGLVSIEIEADRIKIWDFIMSCRAMGRGIEKAMLYVVSSYAITNNKEKVVAHYQPTPKNVPCSKFLSENGFTASGEEFELTALTSVSLPSHIHVTKKDELIENLVTVN